VNVSRLSNSTATCFVFLIDIHAAGVYTDIHTPKKLA
jgi:hypothetical protein